MKIISRYYMLWQLNLKRIKQQDILASKWEQTKEENEEKTAKPQNIKNEMTLKKWLRSKKTHAYITYCVQKLVVQTQILRTFFK